MSGYNLKSEEDVKEFLKNLYIEYKFGCYGEKKPEVCHLLGDYLEAIKREFKEAASIYQKNCDNLDYGRSCAKYGGWKLIGKGSPKDYVAAFKYLSKGCDLGDGIGCTNGGIVAITGGKSVQGENKQAVIERGLKMLEKACVEKKEDKACFFLTGIYTKGIEGTIDKSGRDAYRYSLLSCEYGNPYACMNVSRMHELGEDGIQKNQKLADEFRLRSMELEKQLREQQQTVEFGQGIQP